MSLVPRFFHIPQALRVYRVQELSIFFFGVSQKFLAPFASTLLLAFHFIRLKGLEADEAAFLQLALVNDMASFCLIVSQPRD